MKKFIEIGLLRIRTIVFIQLFLLTSANFLFAGDMVLNPNGSIDMLGKGFDLKVRKFKEGCIQGTPAFMGDKSIHINFLRGNDYARLFSRKHSTAMIGIDIWVFSAKAKGEMLIQKSEVIKRVSEIFMVDYRIGTVSLRNRSFTPLGNSMINEPSSVQRNTCGNRFAQAVEIGSNASLCANIHFNSIDSYKKFKFTVKASFLGGLIKKKKTIRRKIEAHAKYGAFSIMISQQGGSHTKLNEILSTNPTYCGVNNLDPCLVTLDKLYSYLIGQSGYLAGVNSQNAIINKYWVESYQTSGHFELNPDLFPKNDPGFNKIEKQLMEKFAENLNKKEHYQAIKHAENANIGNCEAKLIIIERNLDLLRRAFNTCENCKSFGECDQESQYVLKSLEIV